ncbi:MAG: F0F1 ATP synthase subunit epsilon [Chloroflexi bacterium]|nr:F0F1 ATP synthase subunit epsilon [Ktedonobacteraceae bacterium]MBV8821762.1 F0F1 ATP synthase subunit epsilon [Ktedonobacteraceae bacterium]MBV9020644.1 F0F1 ATP synthase subunit epsilon [Ktedonobacteraceae bacterium]MBV9707189.1 F0F1 ATP synthase subunit epsilon [Chloroflexota bacterium]
MAVTRNNTLHVRVVTAERELYSGEANLVSAPGAEGRLGILPHHAALLALLGSGVLTIKLGEGEEPIFVSGGFLEVSENSVIVLADTAEHADEIDEARAEEARRRAQEALAQAASDEDRAEIEAALAREMSRLKVADIARRSGRRRISMPSSEQQ